MKKIIVLFITILAFYSCKENVKETATTGQEKPEKAAFSIVIHGGAGYIRKDNISPEREVEYRQKLEEAIRVGYDILKNGGTSLDAVQKTINVLEDSPLFNAGKGAVYTFDGEHELDASIMNGKTLDAGAVSGVKTIKSPIALAEKVMEKIV